MNKKKIGCIFLTLLFTLYLVIPYVGKKIINYSLNNSLKNHHGKIEELDIWYFSTTYKIRDLQIYKKDYPEKPLVEIDELKGDLNILEILDQKIALNLAIKGGEINIIDDKDEDKNQTGYKEEKNKAWGEVFETIIPVSIDQFRIEDFKLRFWTKKEKSWNEFSLALDEVEALGILTPNQFKSHYSPVSLKGHFDDLSKLSLTGGANIMKENFPFDFKFKLRNFNFSSLNDIITSYVPIDISKGKIEVFSVLKGNFQDASGGMKIFIDDLDVVGEKETFSSPQNFLFEITGGLINWMIDISSSDDIATQLPLKIEKGEFETEPLIGFWNSFGLRQEDLERNFEIKEL